MRILIVDDSAYIRSRLRKELEKAEYEVFEAGESVEALERIPEVCPDVICLDVDMPGRNGYELCKDIRLGSFGSDNNQSDLQRVPIIFITSTDREEDRARGFQAGGNDFLNKPVSPDELLTSIKRVIRKQLDFSGSTALIVDDSAAIRTILSCELRSQGLKVLQAGDGLEAFAILQNRASEIDLVITDYVMPLCDGAELCRKIRIELGLKDLPVICLTSVDGRSKVVEMFKAGVSDYLTKPFSKEELNARIGVHLKNKTLQDELRLRIVELKRTNNRKDDIVSICSHDLRTPMNGILGFTEVLLLDPQINGENREFLEEIRKSGKLQLDIISDILELGRLESASSVCEQIPVSVSEIIQASTESLKHSAKNKKVELKTEIQWFHPEPPVICGNPKDFIRIFNNLIGNALKFSHSESQVRVWVQGDPDSKIVISVIDQGIGIPSENLPLLFERNEKIRQTGTDGEPSFGYGMSIVKGLVEQNHGEIEVTSQQGKGTTVRITFPAAGDLTKSILKEPEVSTLATVS